MILRKRGETDKQFIKRQSQQIDLLNGQLGKIIEQFNELMIDKNCVPMMEYIRMTSKYSELVERLKRYGLWTGE